MVEAEKQGTTRDLPDRLAATANNVFQALVALSVLLSPIIAFAKSRSLGLVFLLIGLAIIALSVWFRPRGMVPTYGGPRHKLVAGIVGLAVLVGSLGYIFYSSTTVQEQIKCIDPEVRSATTEPCVPAAHFFGRDPKSGKSRIETLSEDANDQLLIQSYAQTQRHIKMVQLNGNSYLRSRLKGAVQGALERGVHIDLLMMDPYSRYPDDIALLDRMNKNGKAYPLRGYQEALLDYASWANQFKNMTIGTYDSYPWTRFTIFDDTSVSFILTPGLQSRSDRYFSDDPIVVAMFRSIYDQFLSCSLRFDNQDQVKKYVDRHDADATTPKSSTCGRATK